MRWPSVSRQGSHCRSKQETTHGEAMRDEEEEEEEEDSDDEDGIEDNDDDDARWVDLTDVEAGTI